MIKDIFQQINSFINLSNWKSFLNGVMFLNSNSRDLEIHCWFWKLSHADLQRNGLACALVSDEGRYTFKYDRFRHLRIPAVNLLPESNFNSLWESPPLPDLILVSNFVVASWIFFSCIPNFDLTHLHFKHTFSVFTCFWKDPYLCVALILAYTSQGNLTRWLCISV